MNKDMKFKVGNIVRIIENQSDHYFKIGEIVEIVKMDDSSVPYRCSNGKENWWVREEDIKLAEYTWEMFKECPIGTKVTFEGGEYLFKVDKDKYGDEFANLNRNFSYEYLENFELDDIDYGKIIKIEEPTYTIVYEPKEVTMPEIEEMKRLTDELCKTCDEFIKKIKEK